MATPHAGSHHLLTTDWRFWRVERPNDTLFATRARYLLSTGVGQNG